MSNVAGVILAGGEGSRMGTLGAEYPKALLPIGNEPLIVHHLRLLARLGVRRAYVVVGYRTADFIRQLRDIEPCGVHVEFVEQEGRLGSAHALGRVRQYIREPFLLLLGDYYFTASEPERMLRRLDAGESAIAVKREPDAQLLRGACAVEVDADRRVVGIVEKPLAPKTDLKGCGFYALQPEFFDTVSLTPRTALRDEYELTVALDLYARAGRRLFGEEIVVRDANLTYPADLLNCNLEWLQRAGHRALVADDAQLGEGLRLEHALVGSGARIEGLESLEDVVVFPGANLKGSGSLRRTLVTSLRCIACGDPA